MASQEACCTRLTPVKFPGAPTAVVRSVSSGGTHMAAVVASEPPSAMHTELAVLPTPQATPDPGTALVGASEGPPHSSLDTVSQKQMRFIEILTPQDGLVSTLQTELMRLKKVTNTCHLSVS